MSKLVKIAGIIVASISISLALAGCSQKQSYNFDGININGMPSWDDTIVQKFKEQGWNLYAQPMFQEGIKDNPTIIFGANKDETCQISFNSEVTLPVNKNIGDKFNSQYNLLGNISSAMSEDRINVEINDIQINVEGKEDKLSMVEAKYDGPWYKGDIQPDITGKMPEPDGIIHYWSALRMLGKNTIPNPMVEAAKGEKNADKVNKDGVAVAVVTYQCLNNSLDNKVIDIIKDNATIIIK